MRKTMNLADAKARFSEVVERAVAGQTTVILRNGMPVAEVRAIGDVDPKQTVARIRAIRERVAAYQAERGESKTPRPRPRALAHEGHRR
jgi:antitoxin (DNA-binding transcriptional repressor) of toxin-antitoxin stability system